MSRTVADRMADAHLLSSELPDKRPQMAKADLRKAERELWRERVGQAIERVRTRSGLSLKEFADAVARDERQCARWITGVEHPQIAAIFSVEQLRQPLIIALAELAGESVEITTAITIRRSA